MNVLKLLVLVVIPSLAACKIQVTSPIQGGVSTKSGAISCPAASSCTIDVSDTNFDETFVAAPQDGYVFAGWKQGLCTGSTAPCKLATTGFENNNALMTLLASPDKVFYLEPTFAPEETCFLDPFVNTSNPVYAPTAVEYQAKSEPGSNLWSDVNTWIDKATGESNGYFPGPEDTVEVPANASVCINGNMAARTVDVFGELFIQETKTSYSLTTHYVHVMGSGARLSVGSEHAPFTKNFTLQLIGTGAASEPLMMSAGSANRKFLMAMMGGTIAMHGEERISWTKLAGNKMYHRGDTALTLAQSVDWRAGDKVIIAPSVSPDAYEEVKITKVSASTITLAKGLAHAHYGGDTVEYEAYAGGPTLHLDQRAEIGLLSRNVKVMGDDSSNTNGFGGHIMVMPGANAHLSNVELYQMGQRGIVARYPIHWHLNGETSGQYIESSSIHKSFNRAVTVHGTSDVRVEDTVAYDIPGHAYFLENGNEERNQFIRNLAINIYRPAPADAILTSDFLFNEPQNRSPAAFWITNPANIFVGNVAAGSPGTGYWFALRANAHEFRGTGVYGNEKQLALFEDNVAHHVMNGIDAFDAIKCEGCLDDLQKNRGWSKVNGQSNVIRRYTAYGNNTGFYTGTNSVNGVISQNNTLEVVDSIFADNRDATMLASHELIRDSVLIAETFNGMTNLNVPRSALVLYDGAAKIQRSNLIGYDSGANPRTSLSNPIGGARKNVNWELEGLSGDLPRQVFKDYASVPPPTGADLLFAQFEGNPRRWGTTIYDRDGSMVGIGKTVITNHPMMMVGPDQIEYAYADSAYTYYTDRQYGHLRVLYGSGQGNQPDVDVTRIDVSGNSVDVFFENHYKVGDGHQQPVIMTNAADGTEFVYELNYDAAFAIKKINLELSDCLAAGQEALIAIADIGAYAGLALTGANVENSVATPFSLQALASSNAVRQATVPSYYVAPTGEVLVKLISANAGASLAYTTIRWD